MRLTVGKDGFVPRTPWSICDVEVLGKAVHRHHASFVVTPERRRGRRSRPPGCLQGEVLAAEPASRPPPPVPMGAPAEDR